MNLTYEKAERAAERLSKRLGNPSWLLGVGIEPHINGGYELSVRLREGYESVFRKIVPTFKGEVKVRKHASVRFHSLFWAEAVRIKVSRKRLSAETLVHALSVEGGGHLRYTMDEIRPFRKLRTVDRMRHAAAFLHTHGGALRIAASSDRCS